MLDPLEPFGFTLEKSMRRTLLSSISGAVITSVRIDGVLHEFSTMPGTTGDMTELIRNPKNSVVPSTIDEPVFVYLRVDGAGDVTGADITPIAGVEVHNLELHIAAIKDPPSDVGLAWAMSRASR